MKFAGQSLLMLSSFILVFIWQSAGLTAYTAPAMGFLILIFIVLSASKKTNLKLDFVGNIFILNTVIFLLIFATGGLSSTLFFTLYFLLFAIAFVFDPNLAFIFVAGAVIVFFPEALKGNTFDNFIKLGSILLISPLAYFFGKQFKGEEKSETEMEAMSERAKDAADTISTDVEQVLKDEKQTLQPDDVNKLNEILEETQDLRDESK